MAAEQEEQVQPSMEERVDAVLNDADILCYFPFVQSARSNHKGQQLDILPLRLRHDVVKIDFREVRTN